MSVASPCVNVCTLDAAGATCLGCLRTLDEIALWSSLGEAERARVVASLPGRRRALESAPGSASVCGGCGARFACGARNASQPCWCAACPPVAPAGAGATCLCPACLAAATHP